MKIDVENKDVSDFYEASYKQHGADAQRKYPNEPLLRFLSGLQRKSRVLEIACGTGANLWAIAQEGFEAWGQDAAPRAIEICREVLDSHGVSAELDVGDFHKLNESFGDESFDAVVEIISLSCTDRKKEVIDGVRRILKSGGYFFSWHVAEERPLLFPDHPPLHVLDEHAAKELLSGFDVKIDVYTRLTYNGHFAKYLAITAKKI